MKHGIFGLITVPLLVTAVSVNAQSDDAVAEMARKAQDPLGDVKAIMSDNTIAFDGGEDGDDTSYGFQIQPVYAIKNDTSFNMIARAVIPIVGVDPGVVLPPLGPEPRPDEDDQWGLSDSIVQYFFSPKGDGGLKWGIGPQVSLKTRTSDQQAGPGWGAGLAGVIFTGVGNWALGAIAMQHWGEEDDFNRATVQGIITYNFESMPGAYLGYNNAITYNWEGDSGQKLTVPLGLTLGRTILLGNGDGLDFSVGAYDLVERPDNAPEWQLKLGLSYFFN
ncbi:MAG: hypothetical protein V7754_07840 [Halioglobus sp.]